VSILHAAASEEPGGREPAPEPLRLVQRFINSNDREGGHERFTSSAALAAWLRAAGLHVSRLDKGDLERTLALREALRALLLANNGYPVDSGALSTLNEESIRTGVVVRFSAADLSLEPSGSGLDRALGRLIAIVFEAMVGGTWPRFKACRRDVCRWAFFDHSKNRSGTWCSMDICGNRVKTRAYWRRMRGQGRVARSPAARSRSSATDLVKERSGQDA
jgi:predicted RNA-binding Zn ribbon-like protein